MITFLVLLVGQCLFLSSASHSNAKSALVASAINMKLSGVTEPKTGEKKSTKIEDLPENVARKAAVEKTYADYLATQVKPSISSNAVVLNDFAKVDFTALSQRNKDFFCYLRIKDFDIDIPVVLDKCDYNGYYYLSHDFNNNPSSGGWVFGDRESGSVGQSFNTILYGHNRLDGKHFGGLWKFLSPLNILQNTVIEVGVSPTTQLSFKPVAVCILKDDDPIYQTGTWRRDTNDSNGEAMRMAFINELKAENKVKHFSTDDLRTVDRFITLSTCYGLDDHTRLIVVGKLLGNG